MPVAFSFRNQVQILKFSEQLSEEEFRQTVAKLEEKIKQGRLQFLFYLEHFKNHDDFSKSKVIQLIRFAFDKKLQLALCLPLKSWPTYTIGTQALAKMFLTETEALTFLNLQDHEKRGDVESPEALKMQETEILLKKYEAFQKPDDLDPFSLKKLVKLYRTLPTLEAIENLERASRDIPQRKENIERLKLQCEQLSIQAFELSATRTLTLNPKEEVSEKKRIELEKKQLLENHIEVKARLAALQSELSSLETQILRLTRPL